MKIVEGKLFAEIGDWYTWCCCQDMERIENEADRQEVQQEIDDPNNLTKPTLFSNKERLISEMCSCDGECTEK